MAVNEDFFRRHLTTPLQREERETRLKETLREKYSPWDAVKAGYKLQTLYAHGPDNKPFFRATGHKPDMAALEAEGYNPELFFDVQSEAEETWMRSKIDRERERRMISDTRPWSAFVGGMGGVATAAPFYALPLGMTVRGPMAVTRLTAAEMGIEAGIEAELQSEQAERPMTESVVNVAAAGLITSVLGGAVKYMSKGESTQLQKSVSDELTRQVQGGGSVGAMSVYASSMADEALVGEPIVQAAGIPSLDKTMAGASTVEARQVGEMLLGTSFARAKHLRGESRGPSIDAEVEDWIKETTWVTRQQDDLFRQWYKREVGKWAGPRGLRLKTSRDAEHEFGEMVADAMRNGDKHSIPEVQKAAEMWRERVVEPIKDEALKVGALMDDRTRAVDAIYRHYQAIVARETRAIQRAMVDMGNIHSRSLQQETAAGKEVGGKPMTKDQQKAVRAWVTDVLEEYGFDVFARVKEDQALARDLGRRLSDGVRSFEASGAPPGPLRPELARRIAEEGGGQVSTDFGDQARLVLAQLEKRLNEVVTDYKGLTSGEGPLVELKGSKILNRTELEDLADALQQGSAGDKFAKEAFAKWGKADARKRGVREAVSGDVRSSMLPRVGFISTLGAPTYFPRMYDWDRIGTNVARFEDMLRNWLRAEGVDSDVAEESVDRLVQKMIVDRGAGVPDAVVVPAAGATKRRTIPIPDSILKEFLINDPQRVMMAHSRSMGWEVATAKRGWNRDLSDQISRVREGYLTEIRKAEAKGDEKQQAELNDEMGRVEKAMKQARARIMGTVMQVENIDPRAFSTKAMRFLRAINTMALMGGVSFTSLPDIARPATRYGMRPFMKSLTVFFRTSEREALKKLGVAMEDTLNSRISRMMDIGESTAPLAKHVEAFMAMTGLPHWTNWMQEIAARAAMHEILDGLRKPKMRARLAQSGLDEGMLKRFRQLHDRQGRPRIPDFDEWAELDYEAYRTFRQVLQSEVDFVIHKVRSGDTPMVMDKEIAKSILQFQSHMMGAHNKYLVAGLQLADAHYFTGVVMAMSVGAVVSFGKDAARGKAWDDKSTSTHILDAIDRSAMAGYFLIPARFFNAQLTGDLPSRFAAQTVMGNLTGPTPGQLENLLRAYYDADLDRALRTTPYQNIWHWRDGTDRVFDMPWER